MGFLAGEFKGLLLPIRGDLDPFGVPAAGEVFTALARQNKEARLIRYRVETHWIEQSQNQQDYMETHLQTPRKQWRNARAQ